MCHYMIIYLYVFTVCLPSWAVSILPATEFSGRDAEKFSKGLPDRSPGPAHVTRAPPSRHKGPAHSLPGPAPPQVARVKARVLVVPAQSDSRPALPGSPGRVLLLSLLWPRSLCHLPTAEGPGSAPAGSPGQLGICHSSKPVISGGSPGSNPCRKAREAQSPPAESDSQPPKSFPRKRARQTAGAGRQPPAY